MRFGLAWLQLIFMLLFQAVPASGQLRALNELCPTILVQYDYELNFSDTERRLVCGSTGVEAWENIPMRQAQFHMRNFLAARGYHRPSFRFEEERLYVKPGVPTLITDIVSKLELPGLDLDRYWAPRGEPLTPEQLNAIEKWVTVQLGRLGYPCPTIRSEGDAVTGEVRLTIETGPPWSIQKIESEPIPAIRGGMLDRYRAFEIGDPYNSMLLELSAERLRASDVVIQTQFLPNCQATEPGLVQQMTLPGKPRIVSFGFGFDTEEYFIVRGSWRNSRFTETASLLDLSGQLSYRQQKIIGSFDWYYLPIPSRHFLRTYLRFEREAEKRYESRSVKYSLAPAWTREFADLRADLYLGPSVEFQTTVRGEGPNTTRLFTLDGSVSLESHDFEYYRASPRSGYQLQLFSSTADRGMGSDITASTYSLTFTKLWNLFSLEPEIWILGLRGNLASTRPGPGTNPEDLPPVFTYFIGGSDDIRGFPRKSLPSGGTGALSKAYLGTELRLNNVLPYKLQPLLFVDGGRLGSVPLKLDPYVLWSPGLGLRWESPIGSIRTSAAYGMVSGPDRERLNYLSRWQFYFSLGEQF